MCIKIAAVPEPHQKQLYIGESMIRLGIRTAIVLDQLADKMVKLADCSNGCYSLAGLVVNVLPFYILYQCGLGFDLLA